MCTEIPTFHVDNATKNYEKIIDDNNNNWFIKECDQPLNRLSFAFV